MKQDLSLIPLDDLIDELESRCDSMVLAYSPLNFSVTDVFKYVYGKGRHDTSVALAGILLNNVMNNWNGQLETLQRLNEEE